MEKKNYTITIEAAKSPEEVFKRINDVSKWWTQYFEGSSAKLNDEFVLRHADAHYSKQKLVEFIPDKKVAWLVTDSLLTWIKKDKYEWTGTKIIFELTPKGDKTLLKFTHEGLVPEKEYYIHSVEFWDRVIKKWIFNFITNVDDNDS